MSFDRVSDSLTLSAAPEFSRLQDNAATAKQIRDVIDALTTLGARINPSSRLHRYVKMFEGIDDPSALSLDHALLDALQFVAIQRALYAMADANTWLPALNSACGGQALAASIHADSRSRSDQFELFTMACLTMAGFTVFQSEPDLRAHVGEHEVAFAAKRLRSIGKFRRNLNRACSQLARQGAPGFAVVDLSFVKLIPKPIYVPRLEQQQVLAAVVLDQFAEEHSRHILDAANRQSVLGVLLHASVICRSIEPIARFVSRRWLLCAATDSEVSRLLTAALQSLGQPAQPRPTKDQSHLSCFRWNWNFRVLGLA